MLPSPARTLSVALVAGLSLLIGPALPAAASHDVTPARVAGDNRVETAAEIARLQYPDGTAHAVIAKAGDFPDALAGAPLASERTAPILLTDERRLRQETIDALQDLGVSSVTILGGPAAIDDSVVQDLRDRGYTVSRVSGQTRYGTAAEVARAVQQANDDNANFPGGRRAVFIANGQRFADAVSASAPAAAEPAQIPILLVEQDRIPAETSQALQDLGIDQAIVVGGTAVVSEDVRQQLEDRGVNTTRVAGANRMATASAVASFAQEFLGFDADTFLLARGDDFPDALAAGPRGGAQRNPILLTQDPTTLSQPTADHLTAQCSAVQVIRAVGGTQAVAARTLNEAELAAEQCHATAPDLAYLSRTGDPQELLTREVPSDTATVVADDVRGSATYDWSPDGTQLVYTRAAADPAASEIVLVSADGTNRQVLTSEGTDDRYPVFSPDGSRIVFTRGPVREPRSDLFVMNADGTGVQQLTADAEAEPFFPDWSPDGTQIAYQRFPRTTGTELVEPQLAVLDADGTDERILTDRAVRPNWSPDGTLIAFASSASTTSSTIKVIRPDGTGERVLAGDVGGPSTAWSPDSALVAFGKRDPDGRSDLAVVSRDGTGERVLADVRAFDADPSFSGDGSTIAFTAAEVEAESDVYLVNVDGSGLRPVTATGTTGSPQFAPAGQGT